MIKFLNDDEQLMFVCIICNQNAVHVNWFKLKYGHGTPS